MIPIAGPPGPFVRRSLGLVAGAALILALTRDAEASPADGRSALEVLRSAEVTVNVGAVLPLFVVYEYPGPSAAVTFGWPLSERTQVVASADLGVVHADGANRYLGSLGVGVRLSPWPRWRGSPWLQLGVGTTGWVERIGVVLPERMVSATDSGGLVTGDLALGVRIGRWEVAAGYDHIVAPRPYYHLYTGNESLPYDGNGRVWIGRTL